MREGEIEGEIYHYVSDKEFDDIDFIEEVEYSGNRYGLSKKEVDDKLKNNDKVFTIMDAKGVNIMKELYGNIVKVIYIYSRPVEVYKRMLIRENMEEADKRINYAIENDEFNNFYLADYVINNFDGTLDKNKKLVKYIVNELEV